MVDRSDGFALLGKDWIPSAKSALGASSEAPAERLAMAKRRRDIPINSACFIVHLLLNSHAACLIIFSIDLCQRCPTLLRDDERSAVAFRHGNHEFYDGPFHRLLVCVCEDNLNLVRS